MTHALLAIAVGLAIGIPEPTPNLDRPDDRLIGRHSRAVTGDATANAIPGHLTVCPNGNICTSGKCVCAPTSTSCNGVCTDLTTDPQHCGNCVRAGSPGQSCVNGTCQ